VHRHVNREREQQKEETLAGSNKTYKEGESIFKMGDPADAMYIIRKGKLKVFFLKGKEEVELAVLTDGGVVGEMAFFDSKPRSASVKALTAVELTVITKADFDKLLTQVPKWMVAMMQSLVGRLRSTNERLQDVEAQVARASTGGGLILPNQKHPFQHCVRGLKILLLGVAKEGVKEGTSVLLPLDSAKALWAEVGGEDAEIFDRILMVCEHLKFLGKKQDSQKRVMLAFLNRGTFTHFSEFFLSYVRKMKPIETFLSAEAIRIFGIMVEEAVSSGYENLNVSINTLKAQQASKGTDVTSWNSVILELGSLPELKITRTANDTTFRLVVKEHKTMAQYLRFIQAFQESKLA
jgi:hypothetical protein